MNEEEIYNEEQEREDEIDNYNQNEENSYDNGNQNEFIDNIENQNENENENDNELNSKNENLKNVDVDAENIKMIQGINSINNIKNQNIQNLNQNENENENQYDIEENIDINNNKNFSNDFYEINNVNIVNKQIKQNPDEIMNDLLLKIRQIKGTRAIKKNDISNKNDLNMDNYKINKNLNLKNNNNQQNNKNEYIGNISINNQIIQNNPKMKEIANLIKDYNQDKKNDDNIQINFYNNNQINILKPDVFFNNNQKKQNNEEENYDTLYQNRHYISIIDGKAIINGQRINVNSGFNTMKNNMNKKFDFGDFNINKNTIKKNRYNNNYMFGFGKDRNSFLENKNNLDFKLKNIKKNYRNNINNNENSKNNYRIFSKNNFFSKEFYNEELNKINDDLFNKNYEILNIRK